ncbi:MAG: hypothetical protein AABZ14_02500 [Candidatus Margulisiibacteriota bacterium]
MMELKRKILENIRRLSLLSKVTFGLIFFNFCSSSYLFFNIGLSPDNPTYWSIVPGYIKLSLIFIVLHVPVFLGLVFSLNQLMKWVIGAYLLATLTIGLWLTYSGFSSYGFSNSSVFLLCFIKIIQKNSELKGQRVFGSRRFHGV